MRARFSRPRVVVFLALTVGFFLRLWFIAQYPVLDGDGPIYTSIARNWFLHGIYGFASTTALGATIPLHATIIRLPGYPLFLGLCFRIFGTANYNAVLLVQAVLDLITCLLIGAIARRLSGPRAGWWALWLAVLCPFTADYTATLLTETLELLAIAAAFYAFLRLVEPVPAPRWRWTILLAISATYAALLRPDGAILGLVLYPAVFLYGRKSLGIPSSLRHVAACLLLTAIPFTAWTIRNWHTFHRFQPLAPRYANEPWESTYPGWNRWVASVCADFACTFDVYWAPGSGSIPFDTLPPRAFDSPAQKQQTRQLIADYNRVLTITPAIDTRFGQLATQRLHDHPLQYRVELPLLRLTDMWLCPRTANLPIALHWWQYRKHPDQTIFALAYAGLNLFLLLADIVGLAKWPHYSWAILAFILLRCALLLTLEAPETRYTLECFPFILVLASIALADIAFVRRPVTSQSGESRTQP